MIEYFNRLENFRHNTFLSILSAGIVFILDLIASPGLAVWILYLIPVLVFPYKRLKQGPFYLLVFSITLLLWYCYFKNSSDSASYAVLYSRALTTIMLFIVSFVQLQRAWTHKKLLSSEKALLESEAKLTAVLDNIPLGVMIITPEKKTVETNRAMRDLWGTPPEADISKVESWTGWRHETGEQIKASELPWFRCVKGEIIKDEIIEVRQFPTGERRLIQVSAAPVPDKAGKIIAGAAILLDITDRLKAGEALKLQTSMLNSILENAPLLISMKDTEGKMVMANSELYKTLAVPPQEEFIGKSVFELFPREIADELWQNDLAVLKSAEPVKSEERVQDKSGNWRTYLTAKFPVHHPDTRELIGICAISADITEIKMAEEVISESRRKLQASELKLLEAQRLAHVGSWELDMITGIRTWTEEASRIFEFEPGEAAPDMDKVISSFHPEDRAWVNETIWEGVKSKTITNFDARLLLPGNKVKYIKYIARTIYDNENKPIKRVGAVADITELKLHQIELENAFRRLQESKTQLLEAQKLARIGNYSIDFKNGGRMEWSDEMYNIWELDKSKPLPAVDDVWKRVHPDDLEELKKVLYHESPAGQRVETEFRILFPQGRVKYVHIITKVTFDEKGNLLKREGIEMDITERKMAQRELERTLQKLEISNEELRQFAYVSSHDLQEPLRMVSSYMALLEKKYSSELDERAKQYIHFAVDGSKRMSNLIKDLLAYSRVNSGAREFQKVDMNMILSNVTGDLQVLIKEKKAVIKASGLPVITADPTQMHQLMQNLISNAIKFQQSEIIPEIMIRANGIENGWLFSVKDNGIGIDPQFHDRIFKVFQRLHERDKYEGTGIGLAVCKKIVERHGGTIWVESEFGQGTTFNFTIPEAGNIIHPEGRDNIEIMGNIN